MTATEMTTKTDAKAISEMAPLRGPKMLRKRGLVLVENERKGIGETGMSVIGWSADVVAKID
ncbi:MAG: hypothetical protein ACR2PG_04805, partial [Hyphomicrobiaceae bacterium]